MDNWILKPYFLNFVLFNYTITKVDAHKLSTNKKSGCLSETAIIL
jgi:hypothetical protein